MDKYQRLFAVASGAIESRKLKSFEGFHFHYPLVDIMRRINGDGSTTFNPEKLEQHGIDPHEFRASWALGFAKETHGMYNNIFTASVVAQRCRTCLETKDEYSFGNYLSDDMKADLKAKLFLNAQPSQAAPDLAV